MRRAMCVVLLACVGVAGMWSAAAAAPDTSDAGDRTAAALTALDDRAADIALRQQALSLVLIEGDANAHARVGELLLAEPPDTALIRMTTAVLAVTRESPPPALHQALYKLLLTTDDTLAGELPLIVSRFMDRKLRDELVAIASDRDAGVTPRVRAVRALAYRQDKPVVGRLIALLAPNQPAPLQAAAADALAQATGLSDFGKSHTAWSVWWDQQKGLSESSWRDLLLENFTERSRRLASQQRQLQARWIATYAQLYRATPEEDRPDMLITMMSDRSSPVAAHLIRQLALDLMEQRLIDRRPFPDPLREALYLALDDPVPTIRAGVADRLRALSDERGAEAVAQRLIDRSENHPDVLRAYLRLMSDQPRAPVVAALVDLLAKQDQVRGDAAGALVAAIDDEQLSGADLAQVKSILSELVTDDTVPEPKVIELLGRVGANGEWSRIAEWLQNEDPATRTAAARAWARSELSLAPLAARSDDPLLQPIAIHAAAARGKRPETLRALAARPPEQIQLREAWQRALVLMAGRTAPDAVIEVVAGLKNNEDFADLRSRMLASAMANLRARAELVDDPADSGSDEATSPPDVAVVADDTAEAVGPLNDDERRTLAALLLARARLLLEMGNPTEAQSELRFVDANKLPLSAQQAQAVEMLTMRVHLAVGELDRAFDAANKVVTGEQASSARTAEVIDMFLAAADRSVATNQVTRAVTILERLTVLGESRSTEDQRRRAREILARANALAARSSNADATAPPRDSATPTPPDDSASRPTPAVPPSDTDNGAAPSTGTAP